MPARKRASKKKAASKKAATAGKYFTKLVKPASNEEYKPGSLLAIRGGMVPTVRIGKRASREI
jgi:hypothetical protein